MIEKGARLPFTPRTRTLTGRLADPGIDRKDGNRSEAAVHGAEQGRQGVRPMDRDQRAAPGAAYRRTP